MSMYSNRLQPALQMLFSERPPIYASCVTISGFSGGTTEQHVITSCRRAAATICPRPCTLHAAAQLQPIHALRLACGARRALLPVAVGAVNIHDVHDKRHQTSDSMIA